MTVKGVNHYVLFVRDIAAMRQFYESALGLEVIEQFEDSAVFLRVPNGGNHHDLGLITVAEGAANMPDAPRLGVYHVAWEVATFNDLLMVRGRLAALNALVGESEHGNSLSLYSKDPQGNEFEVFWMLPQDQWSKRGFGIRPLELERERALWG